MGLFRRKQKSQQPTLEDVLGVVDQWAAQALESAPRTYPNGSALPIDEFVGDLSTACKSLLNSGDDEAANPAISCMLLFQRLGALTKPEGENGYTLSFGLTMTETREALIRAGYSDEADVIKKVSLVVVEYHEQAGNDCTNDLSQS